MEIVFNEKWEAIYIGSNKSISNWIQSESYNFSKEDVDKLRYWCKYINWEIVETLEYQEIQKEKDLIKIKEIIKRGDENLRKFNAIKTIDENKDANKAYKLSLLEQKAKEIEAEYLAEEAILIEKYWIEILNNLL